MAAERLPVLNVLLVRHADAVPTGSAGWEERDDDLHAVYSSPYARAVATVEPTARRRMMSVQLLPDLRERRLTAQATPDWHAHLERSWREPDYALPGAESGRAAQQRARAMLDLLRSRHAAGGTVLAGSHGNLISLLLSTLEEGVDLAFHLAMPNPAMYHLQHDGIGWRVMGGHGFAERTAEG